MATKFKTYEEALEAYDANEITAGEFKKAAQELLAGETSAAPARSAPRANQSAQDIASRNNGVINKALQEAGVIEQDEIFDHSTAARSPELAQMAIAIMGIDREISQGGIRDYRAEVKDIISKFHKPEEKEEAKEAKKEEKSEDKKEEAKEAKKEEKSEDKKEAAKEEKKAVKEENKDSKKEAVDKDGIETDSLVTSQGETIEFNDENETDIENVIKHLNNNERVSVVQQKALADAMERADSNEGVDLWDATPKAAAKGIFNQPTQ